jgi:Tol biopolymer transport system component
VRGRAAVKGFAVTVWAAVLFFVLSSSAFAAFPGANGKIAFQREGLSNSGIADIYTINPDGSAETNLTGNSGFNGWPGWSADGTRIAFTREGSLYVMNPDGSGVVMLTNNPYLDGNPTWSPDGEKIAFTRRDFGVIYIYVINADGSGLKQLTPTGDYFDPAWSPDGQKIAFSGQTGQIETVNAADASGDTILTSGGPFGADGSPNWSPDGSKIAFERFLGTGSEEDEICCPEVFVVNSDGSGEVQLTRSNHSGNPAWSPDGSKIVFETGSGISVMNADGTGVTSVTSSAEQPDWQPVAGPQRSDFKNAAQFCKAKREFMGKGAFEEAYGSNGLGKCVAARQ